jgi:hypothetical protein
MVSRRFFWNFSSKVSEASPLPRAPVMRETVPAAPPTTPLNTLRTPIAMPSANSLGPSTAPYNIQDSGESLLYTVLRILIVIHSGSWILDAGSWIPDPKTATQKRGEKKLLVISFFVAKYITKFKTILFFS